MIAGEATTAFLKKKRREGRSSQHGMRASGQDIIINTYTHTAYTHEEGGLAERKNEGSRLIFSRT